MDGPPHAESNRRERKEKKREKVKKRVSMWKATRRRGIWGSRREKKRGKNKEIRIK